MRIAFVGCGAAGRPLGVAWRRAGHAIGAVHARASAAEAVQVLGAGVPNGPLDDADVVVFATPDDALADVAGAHALAAGQVALHLSGAHPSTILAPTGARTASLHPLCPFADLEPSLAALPDTYFFVEGEAVETAERLARDLGPRVARIGTDAKVLYHAGATIASNYVVTLLGLAHELLTQAGVEEGHALGALVRLARGAVDNVGHVGVARGLTGPAARGDAELIARHIDALPAPTRALYVRLLEATLPVALAKGTLTDEAEAALRRLLPQ
ncbi:MAG: Rossmann-like and DUF2520 domain-containing protein [Planctomycetota bacterium]|jgi:predicted short-subunit dehydrogenase-like oxidoreductase (DUF2520 family)